MLERTMGKPCDEKATKEVRELFDYLEKLQGKGILTGQHTLTKAQEELAYIKKVTGKEPALCGFELLGYSPNIQYETCNEECLTEVRENQGTLEEALAWGRRGGIVTFCWHWFSPMGGKDKSFYTENTSFDPVQAAIPGTLEYEALHSDMKEMAAYLQQFADEKIPVLFRPFHEADGIWFWWGSKGTEVAAKLYRIMFRFFTEECQLHNLLWVWNAPVKDAYPGDDIVDIMTLDTYPPEHEHIDGEEVSKRLREVTDQKMIAIGEIGTLPSIPEMAQHSSKLVYYMTWSKEFATTEKFTSDEMLRSNYHCDYAVTFDKLPAFSWKRK